MVTKSRENIYGASVRAAAEQAAEARKTTDRLACEAWNKRMLGFQGPAQPSPALGDAINAGFLYLEVKRLGLQHTSDGHPGHRAPTEDNTNPRTRSLHAVQAIARGSGASVQAQPSGRVATKRRFQPAIRHQHGGRASGEYHDRHRTVDTTGQICTWSREAEKLFGYCGFRGSWAIHRNHYSASPKAPARAGFGRFARTGISTLPEITTTTAIHGQASS